MTTTTTDDLYDTLVRRHGKAEDWEIEGPITPATMRAHIARLEATAEAEAEDGEVFQAGLLRFQAEGWRRRLAATGAGEGG